MSSREAFVLYPLIHVKPPYLQEQAHARPVAHTQVSNQIVREDKDTSNFRPRPKKPKM
jgi:hypothetical protein